MCIRDRSMAATFLISNARYFQSKNISKILKPK